MLMSKDNQAHQMRVSSAQDTTVALKLKEMGCIINQRLNTIDKQILLKQTTF